jgi:hypothetical protein
MEFAAEWRNPTEDVFLSLVNTPRGNFRICEGLLDGAGFYLQRILGIVEGMPDGPSFESISSGVGRMLQISDAVAARANLCENSLGKETPVETFPKGVIERLASAREVVELGKQSLTELRIPNESLV